MRKHNFNYLDLNYLDSRCNITLVAASNDYKCFILEMCQLLGIDNSGLELTELPSRLKNDIFDKIQGLIGFEKKVVKTTSDKFFDHLEYLLCIAKQEKHRQGRVRIRAWSLSDELKPDDNIIAANDKYRSRVDTIVLLKSLVNYKCFILDICKLLGVGNNDLNVKLSNELKDDIFDKIKALKGVDHRSN